MKKFFINQLISLFSFDFSALRYFQEFLKPPQFLPEEDETPPLSTKVQEKLLTKTASSNIDGDVKKSSTKTGRNRRNTRTRSKMRDKHGL